MGRYPHRSVTQTAARTKASPVGVTCTSLKQVVKGVVDTCAPCLRAFAKNYEIEAGAVYSTLGNTRGAWSMVSGDPLPAAVKVRFSTNRKNWTHMHIMAFTDII